MDSTHQSPSHDPDAAASVDLLSPPDSETAMPLAHRSEEPSPLVRALLASPAFASLSGRSPSLDVDARDEMLSYLVETGRGERDQALGGYFRSGLSIWESLRQVLEWRFGGLDRVPSLLDFASGYGRVTRFIVRDLPPERVWISDIYADAVRFQRERFGVGGFASAVRAEDLACDRRFGAVTVTSLFTHLPEESFVRWLRRLLGLLDPGGVLAFTTHDRGLLEPGREMPERGIRFEAVSESGSLDPGEYGSTWVTEGFVREALERAWPGASLYRLDRGLCNYQDLYLAVPEPDADFSGLAFQREPQRYLELCEMDRCEGKRTCRLRLAGWAFLPGTGAEPGGPLREVRIRLDGQLLGSRGLGGERADVAATFGAAALGSGWSGAFELPAGFSLSTAVLLVEGIDEHGGVSVLHALRLESALLHGAENEVFHLTRELVAERERLADARARAALEEERLRARIAAMEASRFWKLRNRWFGFKRRLGLTDEA